jgi:dihydrofolate reductase
MVEIIVIAAVAENNVIGNKGDIPWRIKEDFLRFKELTMGSSCIMGDRTYNSLPVRPLPGRENIVLTFDKSFNPPGVVVKYSFEDALKHCKNKKKAFICGGASVYKLGLGVADTLELTRVHKNYEGDTFFPEIDFSQWNLEKEEKHEGYSFLTYSRKKTEKKK